MKLITQSEAGLGPLLYAVRSAKRTVDKVIFRFDLEPLEEELEAAVARGVVVRALIAHTNRGGEERLRKLEQRLLKAGVTVCRTKDDLVRGAEVILEEGAPCLRRWPSAAAHVLADAEAMTFLCHCCQGFKAHGPIDKGYVERVVCHTETKRDCSVDCKPQPQAEYVRAQ